MIEILLLVLLGAVFVFIGVLLSDRSIATGSGVRSFLYMVAAIIALAAAVIVPLTLGGAFKGPQDPCRYLISAKPVVYGYHHGPTDYAGRTVLCP